MSDRSIAHFPSSFPPTVATRPAAARPAAARTKLLLEGPVLSTLLRLSAPNVLQLLAIAGMITFDGLFLGRLGADALAGVSLAFPFMMLMQHAANSGMGGGVSSAIARALGAGRRDRADALVCHGFVLALALLAGGIGFMSVTPAAGEQTCRPALAFKEVRFSEMKPPTLERKWTAVLSVDATRCATTSGRFEIVFSRSKEMGIEIEFREQFMWRPDSVDVSVAFSADEAVEGYWLNNIATCPCRE